MNNPLKDRLECFKNTKDDWCPNYPKNQVRLMYTALTDGKFRVAVWGNDDLGMEFDYTSKIEALKIYQQLAKEPVINFNTVKSLGFYGA